MQDPVSEQYNLRRTSLANSEPVQITENNKNHHHRHLAFLIDCEQSLTVPQNQSSNTKLEMRSSE